MLKESDVTVSMSKSRRNETSTVTIFICVIIFTCYSDVRGLPQGAHFSGRKSTTAYSLLDAVDESVDPCQDFFQYACGKWISENPIPKSTSSWTQFDKLDRKLVTDLRNILEKKNKRTDPWPLRDARLMYRTCIDSEAREKTGLQPLTDFLDRFGGWPMVLSNWNESSFNWMQTSATARSTYGDGYLISIDNEQDLINAEKRSIYIDQASLSLGRSTCLNLTDSSNISMTYRDYMKGTAKAIAGWLGSSVSDEQIESDVNGVALFESRLANITISDGERRTVSRMYNPMLINELQSLTESVRTVGAQSQINWLKYLNLIYGAANVTIPNDERVLVCEIEYLKQLITLIDQTPLRVLANYMLWRLVYDWAPQTNRIMNDLRFKFDQVRYGIIEREDRNSECVSEINDLVGYALSYDYVKEVFSSQDRSKVGEMIADLKMAFKSLVDDATWMDSLTKAVAKDKIDSMIELIGYPRWVTNKTEVESYYEGLTLTNVSHFRNVYNVYVFTTLSDLSILRLKPDRTDWESSPSVTNAFYSDEKNAITFPAAILQSPFFVGGRLAAMNYGAIGSIIGHEITHGFDDRGRQSDKFGQMAQWWTGETLAKYLTRAQCFIDQYANYSTPGGQHLDGINTQGENIADNGGLREAFRAYELYVARNGREKAPLGKFTPEQVFFLSFANNFCGSQTQQSLANRVLNDEHSPERYRVIGTLSNSEYFARHFQCPLGTPMNPVRKCILW